MVIPQSYFRKTSAHDPASRAVLLLVVSLAGFGCADNVATPVPLEPSAVVTARERSALADTVRTLAAARGITEMPRPPRTSQNLVQLGQMLLFDNELSGNRNLSCMTCHLPRFAVGDARSFSIGEGGTGLGPERVHADPSFEERNAPPLFNTWVLKNLFWDGRVSIDASAKIHTPAADQLTPEMSAVLEFGAISALGLFPVTNRLEMRGQPGTNELANIPDSDFTRIWGALMQRLGRIPEYRRLFERAYPGQKFEKMTFAHASNAMAAFIIDKLTFSNAPWDRFLNGDDHALTLEQLSGARRFMNAPCSRCHNGPAFSDDQFHNVALAQFGPGKGNGPSGHDDFGRRNITGDPGDIYRFRTTMLRHVELTGPYGHAGQFADLARFIDHYSVSAQKLIAYSDNDIPEPLVRGTLMDNKQAVIDTRDPIILPVAFDSVFVREVTAFMGALTDKRATILEHLTPQHVPSGLPVDGSHGRRVTAAQ